MKELERRFARELFTEVLADVARHRFLLTADRGFADREFFSLVSELGVRFVIRTKANIKVLIGRQWCRLGTLRLPGREHPAQAS